jgi:two-component system sensor histidine kinase DevS
MTSQVSDSAAGGMPAAFRAGPEDEGWELALMADRERIAFDLHDVVIQRVFAAGLALKSIANITVDPQLARRLNHVVDELDATIADMRSTIFALGHRYKRSSGDLRGQILDLVREAAGTLEHDPRTRFYGPIATGVPDDVAEHLVAVLSEALSKLPATPTPPGPPSVPTSPATSCCR